MGVGMSIPFPLLFPLALALPLPLLGVARAEDLPRLDEALPLRVDISAIYPVFDFDLDSCYPSAAISRTGKQNNGLRPTGLGTGLCHNKHFLDVSNTYHRYACVEEQSTEFCGHSFALYMLKDQTHTIFGGGHKHEFPHAVIWTRDGNITAASYSVSDVNLKTISVESVPRQTGHPKFVYHKPGTAKHCFRPAKKNEKAENPYRVFVTPAIASWYTMKGDNVSNTRLREIFAGYDYGGEEVRLANVDGRFLSVLNLFRPKNFPVFPQESGDYSQ